MKSLNFLEKYGFEVINLTNNGKEKDDNIDQAKQLLKDNELSYVYCLEHSKNYDFIDELNNDYNAKILTVRSLDTITEDDVENNDDYLSIMHSNVDLIKQETYK